MREAFATSRKLERQYKEIQMQTEDDRRILAETMSINDQLSMKVKAYKRQIEESVSENILCMISHSVTVYTFSQGGVGPM